MNNANLWAEFKSTPTANLKKQIILNYIKLVHYVIHNSKFINLDILDDRDYFQFGVEGLSEAIDRFDPQYGTKFETYAIQRIRGKIIDELRKLQIKPNLNSSYYKDKKSKGIYKDKYKYGLPEYSNVSIQSPADGGDGYPLYDVIPIDNETPYELAERKEIKELLVKKIKELDEKKRLVLTLYYYEQLNYREIGNMMNLTESRIAQIHSEVLNILNSKLSYLDKE